MDDSTTILIVDDEAVIRKILVKLLHELGYRVLQASNSSEAIVQMRTHRPELVLLDLVMPGLDSMEVLRSVRDDEDLNATAVILISGIDDLDVVADALDAGANDFLPKPFNKRLLELTIRKALEHRRLQDALEQSAQASETFCRQLAHDLNNGITAIMMSAELMLMEVESDQARAPLEDIIASSESLSTMIKQQRQQLIPPKQIS